MAAVTVLYCLKNILDEYNACVGEKAIKRSLSLMIPIPVHFKFFSLAPKVIKGPQSGSHNHMPNRSCYALILYTFVDMFWQESKIKSTYSVRTEQLHDVLTHQFEDKT